MNICPDCKLLNVDEALDTPGQAAATIFMTPGMPEHFSYAMVLYYGPHYYAMVN